MITVKGRVRIYEIKGRKMGKEYRWRQAKILIYGSYIDRIKDLDGKEVTITIGSSSPIQDDIFHKAARILIRKFMELPEECQEKIELNDEEFSILEKLISIIERGG